MKFILFTCLFLTLFIVSFISGDLVNRKESVKAEGNQKYETPVVGIDLGTTYSVVAIYRNGKVEIIPNDQGNRITPSVVSFTEKGEKIVGEAAKNNAPVNPSNTLYDVKRFIGRRFNEVLRKDAKLISYKLVNQEGRTYIKYERKVNGNETKSETVAPEEISAMVLLRLKQFAETYLGEKVNYAVVTVPAYFNDQQRQSTADAGKIAGLNVLRILNEPTAASMAYGLYEKEEQNILVYDLGGGTFDVSLLTIDNGVFEVIATSGDTHLGGEDFDLRIVEHFADKFLKNHNKDVRKNKRSFQKLKREAERAKRVLSTETETQIEIDNLIDGISLSDKLSRAQFEQINRDLFQKTILPVKQVLKDSNLKKSEIDEIVMVGGSTRIPKIQQLVSSFFDNKKLNTDVDPDEAVAYGAAIQAAVLSGTISSQQEIVLIDVTPLSLGIETEGGVMATIIPRNSPVPTEKSDIFTTTGDYQDKLLIPIYEGERRMTRYNRLLGELELSDIPPAPRGVPQIKVAFQLDQNGILKVIAEDQGTKNKKEMTIRKGSLSKDEIEKMTQDAEKNEAEDKKFLENIEIKQKLESYIDEVKSQLANKNIINRIKTSDKNLIMDQLKKTLTWLRSNQADSASTNKFKLQLKQIRKVVNPIISKIYGNDKLSDDDIFSTGSNDDDDEGTISEDDDEIKVEDDSEDDKPISSEDTTDAEEDKKQQEQTTATTETPSTEEKKKEEL